MYRQYSRYHDNYMSSNENEMNYIPSNSICLAISIDISKSVHLFLN